MYALTLAAPLVALALLELVLRFTWPGGAIPAFQRLDAGGVPYLVPSPRVARRYFAGESNPPAPPVDAFLLQKPARAFRVFVLGESSAAGFPYPHNGTFSRVLRDALHDVMPSDSVEVVNMGIAATNSYTISDLAPDVVQQHPDAVLIYAGHNEYYGALGVGSTIGVGSSPRVVHAYLAAERLRLFMALRAGVARIMAATHAHDARDSSIATFMETIARDQGIALDGDAYRAGLEQLHGNLASALRDFHEHGIPVYIASIESNVRSQRPFVSPDNAAAVQAFDSGQSALARGDTVAARALLTRARDVDVIRFRAPTAVNAVIRRVATEEGARYVAVAEHLDSLSPGGIPGAELFLEHVHPNAGGYAEIARTFFDVLRADGFRGHTADLSRLAGWDVYRRRMALTAFDERIVAHTVRTVTTRWPFVARAQAQDYRGTYRPVGISDSLALLVSRGGMTWAEAKLRVAAAQEAAGHPDSALAEYQGLARDAPWRELPNRLVGRTLLTLGQPAEAEVWLQRAERLQPSAEAVYLLGRIALERRDFDRAIALLDEAVRMTPQKPEPLYRLSLAFGLSHNLVPARAAAARAAALDPRLPGLAEWMRVLGMRAP